MGLRPRPALPWQAGRFVAIDEMLSIGLVPERLCTCPVLYREIRIRGEELPCFFPGLFHVSRPRQTCRQDTLRAEAVRRLMPKCLHGIGVLTRCVLGEP